MITPNSVHSRKMAASVAGISVLAIAAILLLSVAPFLSSAAGTTVTVQTSAAAYPSGQAGTQIPISGSVTPAPGSSGYSVTLEVTNPSGLFYAVSTPVNATTGAFSYTVVTGTAADLWGNGTYTLTAVYASSGTGPTVDASTTFTYGLVTSISTTSSSGSKSTGGTTTDVTTIITDITTVFSTGGPTTIVSGTGGTTIMTTLVTTIVSSGAPTTIQTTVSSSGTGLAEALGAVGIVIAIIAGGLAAMALRKR